MALGLFVLMVGVGTRLVADMVRMSSAHISRATQLRLAQTGAEGSVVQRQALAEKYRTGLTVAFSAQRAGQGVQRTRVSVTHGQQQAVQLTVVDL